MAVPRNKPGGCGGRWDYQFSSGRLPSSIAYPPGEGVDNTVALLTENGASLFTEDGQRILVE